MKMFEELDDKQFDQLLDAVPKNDLKNLVKSAGIEVDGTESEDELRGMYKAASAVNEALTRRLYKLHKVNEGYKNPNADSMEKIEKDAKNDVEIIIEASPVIKKSRSRLVKWHTKRWIQNYSRN